MADVAHKDYYVVEEFALMRDQLARPFERHIVSAGQRDQRLQVNGGSYSLTTRRCQARSARAERRKLIYPRHLGWALVSVRVSPCQVH